MTPIVTMNIGALILNDDVVIMATIEQLVLYTPCNYMPQELE